MQLRKLLAGNFKEKLHHHLSAEQTKQNSRVFVHKRDQAGFREHQNNTPVLASGKRRAVVDAFLLLPIDYHRRVRCARQTILAATPAAKSILSAAFVGRGVLLRQQPRNHLGDISKEMAPTEHKPGGECSAFIKAPKNLVRKSIPRRSAPQLSRRARLVTTSNAASSGFCGKLLVQVINRRIISLPVVSGIACQAIRTILEAPAQFGEVIEGFYTPRLSEDRLDLVRFLVFAISGGDGAFIGVKSSLDTLNREREEI